MLSQELDSVSTRRQFLRAGVAVGAATLAAVLSGCSVLRLTPTTTRREHLVRLYVPDSKLEFAFATDILQPITSGMAMGAGPKNEKPIISLSPTTGNVEDIYEAVFWESLNPELFKFTEKQNPTEFPLPLGMDEGRIPTFQNRWFNSVLETFSTRPGGYRIRKGYISPRHPMLIQSGVILYEAVEVSPSNPGMVLDEPKDRTFMLSHTTGVNGYLYTRYALPKTGPA